MGLVKRMIRVARLDASVYEEVKAEPALIKQAMAVVVLSASASWIGSPLRDIGALVLVGSVVLALIIWFVLALLIYLIGARILAEPQTKADLGRLLRMTGFANSAGVIQVLGIIPGLLTLVVVVVAIWVPVAQVVAIRHALEYTSVWRAVGVFFLAAFVVVLAGAILGYIFGLLLPGLISG